MIGEDDSGDELEIEKQALFVEFPTRTIDLDTVPRDGHEYIHITRLEAANLFVNEEEEASGKPPEENEQKLMRQEARNFAAEFSNFAIKFSTETAKAYLKTKFPTKVTFPGHGPSSVQEWCVFCLGSKLYSKIYEAPCEEIEGNLPLLSIIVHFDSYTAFTLLKHLHEWFLKLGMEESIGRWIYAVFACIRKPVHGNCMRLLKTLYSDCKNRLKDCDESERSQLYLISAILEYYFCVGSDELGPDLETFLKLKI